MIAIGSGSIGIIGNQICMVAIRQYRITAETRRTWHGLGVDSGTMAMYVADVAVVAADGGRGRTDPKVRRPPTLAVASSRGEVVKGLSRLAMRSLVYGGAEQGVAGFTCIALVGRC